MGSTTRRLAVSEAAGAAAVLNRGFGPALAASHACLACVVSEAMSLGATCARRDSSVSG